MLNALLSRWRIFPASDAADIVQQSCLAAAPKPAAIASAPIAISHRIAVKNIGDRSNPIAVQYATGRATVWTAPGAGPSLFGIGSMLHMATARSQIWGTGMTAPDWGAGDVIAEKVWALRGKLTHAHLTRLLPGLRDVPLGDPAYLIGRRVAAMTPTPSPTYRLGIVPHLNDRDHPTMVHLRRQDGVLFLGDVEPDRDFFARMMACEAIASSSLHGLVFAEALGIPNVWVHFESRGAKSGFKYHDWFSMARQPPAGPLALKASPQSADLTAAAALHDMTIDEDALRHAIPQAALDELSVRRPKARRTVHFVTCRRRPLPIFLVCGNQGTLLHDLAAGYRQQSVPTELILVDGGNADRKTRAAIDQLRQAGAVVQRVNQVAGQATPVRDAIRRYFKDWGEPQRFAVAAGAIDLSNASPDALAVYDELLDRFATVAGVGPMVRIQELSPRIPDGARIANAEIAAHWRQQPRWCETAFGPAAFVSSSLAGTFALRRAGARPAGAGSGLRVQYPFDARNLDWQAATVACSADSVTSPAGPYFVVERGPDGGLRTVMINAGGTE